MPKVISPEGLAQLDRYKYKSGGYSWGDNQLNKYYWEPLAKFVPKWMAPNLVTFIGLGFLAATVVPLVIYTPDLKSPAPAWVYIFIGICQFFYQTMDAIDGKHARNIGASSPLGQLFDHGCDSIGTVFVSLAIAAAVRFGCSPWTAAVLLFIQAPFFLAQWEEYHTHMMRTFTGYIGVTEGQNIAILVIMAPAFFGQDFWLTPVSKVFPYPIARVLEAVHITELAKVLFLCLASVNIWLSSHNFNNVAKALKTPIDPAKPQDQQEHLRRQEKGFHLLLPLATLVIFGYCYQQTAGFHRYPWIGFATLGAVFSHLTSQIIVRSLTCETFSLVQWTVIFLPLIVINAFSKKLFGINPIINEDIVVFVYFIFVCGAVTYFATSAIDDITKHLGIYCLTVGKRPRADAANTKTKSVSPRAAVTSPRAAAVISPRAAAVTSPRAAANAKTKSVSPNANGPTRNKFE